MTDINGAIYFLNSTVVSFTSSLGFNGNPSTLSVTLAEDPDLNQEYGVSSPASNPNTYAVGGTRWEDGNPGTFVEFEIQSGTGPNADDFKFGGIVTDWRRKNDISGNTVTANIVDPRIIFSGIPVITDINTSEGNGYDTDGRNVIDVLAFWGNSVDAGWSRKGIPWTAVYKVLTTGRYYTFYNEQFMILVDNSWYSYIASDYRVPVQNTTLDQFFNQVAQDNNIDYYIKAERNSTIGAILITVYPIPRNNTDSMDDTGLHYLLSGWENGDRLKNVEYGRELRTDPSHVMLYGDNIKNFHINSKEYIYPIFNRFNDGTYSDRAIIDLSNIVEGGGLPTINVEKMKLSGAGLYTKSRYSEGIKGYIATTPILRAALHSKEAWATLVWYEYKDGGGLSTAGANSFDASSFNSLLGGSGGASGGSLGSNTPENLGIFKPPFNRDKGAAGFNAFSSGSSSQSEAKMEAVYRVTKKTAEEFYGKVFITPLPYSDLVDSMISGGLAGGGPNQYFSQDKRFLIEYDVVGEAPAIDNFTGGSMNLPQKITASESDEFQTAEGLVKGLLSFNTESITSKFPQAEMSYNAKDRYLNTGGDLYTSDVSFVQYQFDPRFAIMRLGEPIKTGFGKVRGVNLEYDADGNVSGHNISIHDARPPKDKDMSGGTQEFLSYLYSDFSVVTGLTDASGPIAVDGPGKRIDSAHYNTLLYFSSINNKEKIGLGQGHFTGYSSDGNEIGSSITAYVPIKWNFGRYGVWESSPSHGDVFVPTKVAIDSSLNPWNYGSIAAMNSAGSTIASNMQSKTTTLGYANATVEGFPEMALGVSVGNNLTRLSDVSMSYGIEGVVTQYRFKTFFGPVGFHKKRVVDMINRTTFEKGGGDRVSIEDIRREMIKAEQAKGMGITLNGIAGGTGNTSGAGSGAGSNNIIRSNNPLIGGSAEPDVSSAPSNEFNQSLSSNGGSYLFANSYYAGLSELWLPFYTGEADGRGPDLDGVPEDT
jgi:hypothetical protein